MRFELFEGWSVPIVSIVDAAASKLIWIGKGSHKSRTELRAMVRKLSLQQRREFERLAASLGHSSLLTEVLGERDEVEEQQAAAR